MTPLSSGLYQRAASQIFSTSRLLRRKPLLPSLPLPLPCYCLDLNAGIYGFFGDLIDGSVDRRFSKLTLTSEMILPLPRICWAKLAGTFMDVSRYG